MADIRIPPTSENNFKIRLPLDLLSIVESSKYKPQLNQSSLRRQKVYPVFLQLNFVEDGYEFADKRVKKAKSKSKIIEETLKCTLDACNKEFSDAISLRKHQSIHSERQYLCPMENCGRQFLDNSKLRRHMLVHTGEKPFRCEFCSKCFSLDFNLKTHLRIHTGEKPYQCCFAGCMKRFTQSSNLTAHERTHYMTEAEIKIRVPKQNDCEVLIDRTGNNSRQAFSLEPPPFEMFSNAFISASALPEITLFVSTSALPSNDH